VTDGIRCVEPEGVRTADGELHELDVLLLATGFHADAFMRPMEVVGRYGLTLEEAWAGGPVAYLSVSMPDFPNLFMLNGPNGPVGNFSLIEVAERQFAYIEQLLERLESGEASEICATAEATAAHEKARVEAAANTIWVTGCNSWYLDDRGVPAAWPWPFQRFRDVMQEPDVSAFELR
jgi:cation diffusion facilitator CzcD-associated flavoprotein CzcO